MLTELKKQIAPHLKQWLGDDESTIYKALELPKQLEHGHVAWPVFSLAKSLRKAPTAIAQEIVEQLKAKQIDTVEAITSIAGFVNFKFNDDYVQKVLFETVEKAGTNLGYSTFGKGKNLVIDYSSPNVAKPMHVGHLRATMIGQAIRNLASSQGYNVIGINYLGDWGIQFGKLAYALDTWKSEYPMDTEPFQSLFKMYVRFHAEEETNGELKNKGAEYFKKLEAQDPHVVQMWKYIREMSLNEYQKLYEVLGVKFDLIQGESFYNDKMDAAIAKLSAAGILEESQGAQVVFVGDEMPPCIVKKSDGSSIYATRDIASAFYRHDVLKGDEILYVVGQDQILHFKQVFAVIKKLNLPWADSLHHIHFGMYRFKDSENNSMKMSTRKGQVITANDVVSRAIDMALTIVSAKNPDMPELEQREIARKIGVGAIIFHDMVNDRIKNVEFDWERILDFEGDTGPYVQYSIVRCRSLLRKKGDGFIPAFTTILKTDEERELIRLLMNYSDTLNAAFRNYKPNILGQYILDVVHHFGHFYNKHRILGEALEIEQSRMTLIHLTEKVLVAGLTVLGMSCPDRM